MKRNFFEKFAALATHKAGLRTIYRFLSPHQSSAKDAAQKEVGERIIKFLLQSDVSPQMFFDARHLNGPDGDNFAAFWDELGAYLELDAGTNSHERVASLQCCFF